jgi:hypothetical protein
VYFYIKYRQTVLSILYVLRSCLGLILIRTYCIMLLWYVLLVYSPSYFESKYGVHNLSATFSIVVDIDDSDGL